MYKDPNEHKERNRVYREIREEKLKEYKPEPHVLIVLFLLALLTMFLIDLLAKNGISLP